MLQQNMKKKEKRIHPTQKPVDLFGQILRDYSEDGALILDPFSGSGTTALAARLLKRRFICIEKDAEYWRASVERLEEAKKQGGIILRVDKAGRAVYRFGVWIYKPPYM